MRLSFLPFLLLAVPLAEIAMFVLVGSRIGVLPTIGLVVLTAIAGATLLRIQGFGIVNRIRADIDAGRVPGRELANGVMVMAAGLLLLTPGFITDTLGLLLFVPAVRRAVWSFFARRITVVGLGDRPFSGSHPRPDPARGGRGRTIDLDPEDFSEEPSGGDGDDDGRPAQRIGDSPWRKPGGR